jgi:prefoldin alpha subunit
MARQQHCCLLVDPKAVHWNFNVRRHFPYRPSQYLRNLMANPQEPQGTPISALTIEQLINLKEQFEGELQKLTATLQLTVETIAKTQAARDSLAAFATSEKGKDILIPITESLYVHGTIHETKRPIIELGTGYFVETSVDNASQFFSRRIGRLNSQQDKLRATHKEKQSQYQLIVNIANQKLQASRPAAH